MSVIMDKHGITAVTPGVTVHEVCPACQGAQRAGQLGPEGWRTGPCADCSGSGQVSPARMRLLCIADVHARFDAFPPDEMPDADVCLVAGDITNQARGGGAAVTCIAHLLDMEQADVEKRYGRAVDEIIQLKEINAAIDWMMALRDRYHRVLYVPGNHDKGVTNDTFRIVNFDANGYIYGIDRTVVGIDCYQFVGTSLTTAFDAPALARRWANTTASRLADKLDFETLSRADVVVSHGPPLNCLDEANLRTDTGIIERRIGSPGLRAYIERYQPRLVVCGHAHQATGFDTIGRTPVFNVARAAALITLEEDGSVSWEVDWFAEFPVGQRSGAWSPSSAEGKATHH